MDLTANDSKASPKVLLGELASSARTVLSLIEQLESTPEGSESYLALEGELYARVNQVKFDAEDWVTALEAEDE